MYLNTPLRSQSRQLPDVISIQISQPDLLSIQITFQIPNYFQIILKLLGSKNTAACSPSVSICNRAVGSWTKSSDLVQKIPLSPFYSLSLSSRSMVNMRTLAEYDNFYDDDNFMMMTRFWWWWCCGGDPNAKSQMFLLRPPAFGGQSCLRDQMISRLPEVCFRFQKKGNSSEFNSRDDGTIIWKV